ncbi:MAG: MerR family transcriptional regulator [Betaproteobacteria bacterium]|nr:MerR family transcriptional regulator [Betaproteobacteria bacterium]
MQSRNEAKVALPPIPAKRYFTIGEVSELCGVKPHVLRYWEQEFTQLRPMKRRGNRRYYQHHEVLLVRRIRDLLYEQGFTISGARNRLGDATARSRNGAASVGEGDAHAADEFDLAGEASSEPPLEGAGQPVPIGPQTLIAVRADLLRALSLLDPD